MTSMSPTPSTPLSTSPPTLEQNLLPLFIGITGHRDLREADLQPLREAVRREIQSLRARYPHTPLVALSPLGEGADRLIACVALEEGCNLIVPLPLPRASYEDSFEDDESRAEFARLLERAQAVFTLPWIECGHENGNGTSQNAPTEAQIEVQYAAMGAYLARYSHVLLALWDGDDLPAHERTGGTAHIVRLRLHGAPPPYGPVISPLERAGYGAVHHVLTPRQSRPLPDGSKDKTLFEMRVLPDARAAEDFGRIDAFNADVGKYGTSFGEQAEQNARALLFPPSESPSTGAMPDVPTTLRFAAVGLRLVGHPLDLLLPSSDAHHAAHFRSGFSGGAVVQPVPFSPARLASRRKRSHSRGARVARGRRAHQKRRRGAGEKRRIHVVPWHRA